MRDTITQHRVKKYKGCLEDIKDKCDRKMKRPTMKEICTIHKVSQTLIPILRDRGVLKRKGGGRSSQWHWNQVYFINPRFVRMLLKSMAKNNHYKYKDRMNGPHDAQASVEAPDKVIDEVHHEVIHEPKKRTKRTPSKMAKEKASGFHLSIGWGLIKIETK